ncbi:hypothetical protein BGZ83_010429 [Gryganskiella cystojenkinii]|nr:hypothetical protein BGZ83_010429 [Gryganskiella cystojenkinii]
MSDMGLWELDPSTLQELLNTAPDHTGDNHNNVTTLEQEHDSVKHTEIITKNQDRFQPKRQYFVEGRIIHKRKLSRRLFFLDLIFVRRRIQSTKDDNNDKTKSIDIKEQEVNNSQWEDRPSERPSASDEPNPSRATLMSRVEVITRFPTHTLKDLDDLWCKVHLGSVVRIVGDIELSKKKQISADDTQVQQQPQQQNGNSRKSEQWSALMHCLDIETLELWTGKEPFQPHPGAAEIHTGRGHDDQTGAASNNKNNKRKSTDMLESTDEVQRGDASQSHCKFWLNSGKCNKNPCPFWHETDPTKLKVERKRWVEETFSREFLTSGAGVLDIAGGRGDLSWELQTRQGIKSTIVEPRAGKGMRKWQRRWLAEFIAKSQGPIVPERMDLEEPKTGNDNDEEDDDKDQGAEDQEPAGLADFIPTVKTFELQATEPSRIQAMLDDRFLEAQQQLMHDASILVGLHPDQATEPIVRAALKVGKPFAVIPCCVFGRENPHRRLPNDKVATTEDVGHSNISNGSESTDTRPVTSYDDFVTWLATLHPKIETTWLNFEGMNRVLFWRGPNHSPSP